MAAEEGARKRDDAMVLRSGDSMSPPPVVPIALVPGEPLETAGGVPLETGERVVFFFAPSHRVTRWTYILVGLLLTVLVFGVVLVVYGLLYERWALAFVAITDRRVIVRKGSRPARWLFLRDVAELRAKRSRAAAPGVVAEPGSGLAAKAAQTDPKFWEGAEAIVVRGKKGALSIDASAPPMRVGPALANALYTDGWTARVPTASYPQ